MEIVSTDVVRALAQDEVVPCFQPIVELRGGRLVGFEVLARWAHPVHGLILPRDFISMAEHYGLIGQLTRQVVQKALRGAVVLPAPLTLSINISPVQFCERGLPADIRKMAQESGFALDRIKIEITESALLANLEDARKNAIAFRAMGCKLALDDFGTGYSSLCHLQALPFDELKIDRSFVASMTNKRASRKIAAAIVGLAHSLGMVAVAEGVETEAQAEILLRLGCPMGQGWLYGRPQTADKLTAMVAAQPISLPVQLSKTDHESSSTALESQPTLRLAQLQAIYDGAPVGLCFLDCDLRYVSLNQRLATMNGRSVDEHLGRTVQEVHPEWFPKYEPYIRRALQGEAINGVETLRSGAISTDRVRRTLVSYQPVVDEVEEVVGVSISVIDITDQLRIEAGHPVNDSTLISEGESMLRIPWMTDPDGNRLSPDSHWLETDQLSRNGTSHLTWLESPYADTVESTEKTMKIALRTGESIDLEYRVKGPNDVWRWMRSRGSPHFSSDGSVTRWYGNELDVDERKQIDEAFRKTRAKTMVIFDAVPVGVIVADV